MARVQEALVVAGEGRNKAEAETARLKVKQTYLLLELGETKDKVSSLHSQAGRDKKVMEEDYQKALEVIFSHGYECCVFKHNIYRDHSEVPNGMLDFADPLPPVFFVNLGFPPIQAASKTTTTKALPSETTKEPMEVAAAKDQSRL